jgi:hypothetical protein
LDSALGLAVEALAPWANVDGASAKARKGKAILRQALDYFACSGGGDFAAFLGLLAALPLEVSQIDRADQIAAELGQLLTAAMINDPLFAGRGESADPGQLLSPSAGKRARVSVISFIGLSDEARPDSALSSPPRHRAACTTTSRETPQRSSSGESTAPRRSRWSKGWREPAEAAPTESDAWRLDSFMPRAKAYPKYSSGHDSA